jgi:large subunit ribosomal protein L15
VEQLNRFQDGERITPERLADVGLIRHTTREVKLLGDGSLTKRLTVVVHRTSEQAKAKVVQVGGSVELIEMGDSH